MKSSTSDIKRELVSLLGEDRVLIRKEDLAVYGYDASGLRFMPWGVAFPDTAEHVGAIMRMANERRFYVIPRGSGTGMTGGSLPVKSGLILALSRMNRILRLDEENMVAIVEPGVITGHLQEQAERCGLFYPPDPASLHVSTIGGNVAECAGGARAVKYGVTRDYVLGLEAVLPTGERIKTGVETAKGVVGYDLTRLLIGSEGTLAVITKIALKLIPLPPHRKTLAASFRRLDQAASAVRDIMMSRIVPSVLEFMDRATVHCVEERLNLGLYKGAGAVIFAEVDGQQEDVKLQAAKLEEIAIRNEAHTIRIARDRSEEEEMWRFRRSISPALFHYAPHKVNEDIVVPRSRVPEMVLKIEEIGKEEDLLITTFGHAGDGNLHINIMLDKRDPEQSRRASNMADRIFRETIRLGGTLSGEHGVGITKAPFLSMEIDDLGQDVMKRIKKAFDPNGILNPGKIFLEGRKEEMVWKLFHLDD
ncbi:MAG: FAD-binding protein [Deltaproteobacteria bacterium]|nr:FAD-binding protein [Deltaproteobacteria bacterium]